MRRRRGGGLSRRQRECLEARGKRMTAKETGKALNISPHTVAMHWRNARLKIEAERTAQQRPVEPGRPGKPAELREPLLERGCRTLVLAALGFGLFSAVLTLLGWLLLYFSPRFAHLWP